MIKATPGKDGIWIERLTEEPLAKRPALFLDRDGVLVEEVGYLHRVADVRLLPDIAELLQVGAAVGWALVLVTNQSGIGRGLYGWEDFAQTQTRLLELLAAEGVRLDMVLACPFHAEGQGTFRYLDHPFRKPAPGMLLKAAELLNLELSRSWIVGDQITDLLAGKAAGLEGGILVGTGHGAAHLSAAQALAHPDYSVRVAPDAGAAADLLRSITKSAPARR